MGERCNNAHVTLARDKQRHSVQLFFLSKHGHKNSPKLANSEAVAAQKALRAEIDLKAANNRAPRVGAGSKAKAAKAKAKSKRKRPKKVGFSTQPSSSAAGSDAVSDSTSEAPSASESQSSQQASGGRRAVSAPWSPPEELLSFHTTRKEAELQCLLDGPDEGWLADLDQADPLLPLPHPQDSSRGVAQRLQVMSEIDKDLEASSPLGTLHLPPDQDAGARDTDPWLINPLVIDPSGNFPASLLGTYLRNGLLSRRLEEKKGLRPVPD
jgi:hypothetical protein